MKEIKYGQIGERLREERMRVQVSQVDFADACRSSRNALMQWERGEATPNAAVLALMAGLGIDVLYVVTGRRSGASDDTLAPAEKELLSAWRQANAKGRALLSAAVEVLRPEQVSQN